MIRNAIVLALACAFANPGTTCLANPADWNVGFLLSEEAFSIKVGAKPGCGDGYDGQTPVDIAGIQYGISMLLHREVGSGWSGPTGFYKWDYESPIPSASSKTWNDIYLWSQNWTPSLGDRVGVGRTTSQAALAGYWASLVIDYVPASLNWTGPMQYSFPLDWQGVGVGYLPVPITSNPTDPTQVTRLHLTVYAPEPSSLLALLVGLGGLGAMLRRRR